MSSYALAQAAVLERHEIAESGAQLLDGYAGLIAECIEGYNWDVSEYRNELRVRDRIAHVLEDLVLRAFPEHAVFAARVAELDRAFQTLAHPDCHLPRSGPWWRHLVLAYAGEPYAEYYCSADEFDVGSPPEPEQ